MSEKNVETKEISVEERLRALYNLQMVVSEIDKIRTVRGELPLEVQDLEDEVAGLKTRIEKCQTTSLSFLCVILAARKDGKCPAVARNAAGCALNMGQ